MADATMPRPTRLHEAQLEVVTALVQAARQTDTDAFALLNACLDAQMRLAQFDLSLMRAMPWQDAFQRARSLSQAATELLAQLEKLRTRVENEGAAVTGARRRLKGRQERREGAGGLG